MVVLINIGPSRVLLMMILVFCFLSVGWVNLTVNRTLFQKLEVRKSTLMKLSVPEDQRDLAKQILRKELMSSECSDMEVLDDGSERPIIAVKPLSWRSGKANRLLRRLDNRTKSKLSKQSIQQTLPRVIGEASTRPKPLDIPEDFWGFTAQ